MVDDRENLDPEDKKEDSFEFDSAGEAIEYISLDQAEIVAMRAASEEPGEYGQGNEGLRMVFELVEEEERGDYYVITMAFRPGGNWEGTRGQEQFFIEKQGVVAHRQVLSVPSPVRRFSVIPVVIGLAVVVAVALGGVVISVGLFDSGGAGKEVAGPIITPAIVSTISVPPGTPAVVALAVSSPVPVQTGIGVRRASYSSVVSSPPSVPAVATVGLSPTRIPAPVTVSFPDAQLDAAVRKALGEASQDEITAEELATLEMFDARDRGILYLSGLEHATNLTELVLRSNPLSQESIDIHVPNLKSRGVDVAR
jgi:hypothetical protein